jgi:hypothetical protein
MVIFGATTWIARREAIAARALGPDTGARS